MICGGTTSQEGSPCANTLTGSLYSSTSGSAKLNAIYFRTGLLWIGGSFRIGAPAVFFAGLVIMTLNCILLNRINFMLCSVMMCISSIVGSIFLNLRNISNFTFGVDNIFDVPDVLNILFNTLQYFTFYIIILIVLALYNYATHPKVKIEQSKYPNTKKR